MQHYAGGQIKNNHVTGKGQVSRQENSPIYFGSRIPTATFQAPTFGMREGLRSRTNGGGNGTKTVKESVNASGVDIVRTDPYLWRLRVEHGRQTWHYISPEQAEEWPQSIPDKYHLGLDTVYPLQTTLIAESPKTLKAKDHSRSSQERNVIFRSVAN